eukprot:12740986-Alexandrium_andersonii.AAC.1
MTRSSSLLSPECPSPRLWSRALVCRAPQLQEVGREEELPGVLNDQEGADGVAQGAELRLRT